MGRRRGIMSEELKYELAKDLGFYETVVREGWEGIRTKDAGNMVKRAIQIAEEKLAKDYRHNQAAAPAQQSYNAPSVRPQQQMSYGAPAAPSPVGSFVSGTFGSRQPQQAQRSYSQQQPQGYGYGYSRGNGFVPAYPSNPPIPASPETGVQSQVLN